MVDIGQGDAVGRATSGACGSGGGKIEMSSDGGKTFSPVSLESAEVVLRLAVTDADKAKVVVADSKCETVTTFATENGGGTWFEDDPMTWSKAAEVGAKVHAPEGDVDVPCGSGASVLSLSTLGEQQAYALCSDGTVARSDDGGGDWEKQGTAKDAADLDFIDAENGLAVAAGGSSCAGVAVLKTSDAGKEWAEQGCIETDATEMADISADGERAYVAAGKVVWFSDDGGESWKQQTQ
ncbi:WD40/YVTN/BNR-like repeat-containing protein [Flindersiella endophytica]